MVSAVVDLPQPDSPEGWVSPRCTVKSPSAARTAPADAGTPRPGGSASSNCPARVGGRCRWCYQCSLAMSPSLGIHPANRAFQDPLPSVEIFPLPTVFKCPFTARGRTSIRFLVKHWRLSFNGKANFVRSLLIDAWQAAKTIQSYRDERVGKFADWTLH